jgi:hypothetical protein
MVVFSGEAIQAPLTSNSTVVAAKERKVFYIVISFSKGGIGFSSNFVVSFMN